MVFNVTIGFQNLENKDATEKEGKKYALFIGDTIQINDEATATNLTKDKKKAKNISIFLRVGKQNRFYSRDVLSQY